MNREGHENTQFFYGTEVEHTPAFGKYTMFVVGVQTTDDIAVHLTCGSDPVEHIFFGANMSFPTVPGTADWAVWEETIKYFLNKGYLCTLDIDVALVEGLTNCSLCEYNNFIPMISVKLPYINKFGYNATLKLDDRDFQATNPGVWCYSLHSLMNRSAFTDWSKYSEDKII
jgi:hypothetical protein